MRTSITQKLVQELKPDTDAWIYDTQMPGFVLRVRPSGKHSYLARLGRGKWFTLGRADVLKPEEARTLAKNKIGDVSKGKDPIAEKREQREKDARATADALTLDAFLTEHYEPWVTANQKTGQATVDRIRARFAPWLSTPLREIDPFAVERWRSQRLKDGRTAATINRDLVTLKAALTKAVKWQKTTRLVAHPLKDVKLATIDTIGKVRYLSPAEEQRLRAALEARDETRRGGRERGNAWRRARGYAERSAHGTYTDHLTPLTLVALNTGLRFGELTALTWADVDLTRKIVTVRGETAKSDKTRYVPLNTEAVKVLKQWKRDGAADGASVFPGKTGGEPLVEIKTAWMKLLKAAKISRFRFHDTRHHFASRLVQNGIDLNTVRELLGHSDIKMVLRYAHLSAEHKAAAVAKLVAQ
jgi:integrase